MRREACIEFLGGKPEGKRPHEDPCVDGRIMDLQEAGWGAWIGLIWLRIGTGGGHL